MPTPIKDFADTRFYPHAGLLTWHPTGVFDDAFASRVVEFLESEEQLAEAPFHRFVDLSGLTEIRLTVGHAFQISQRRRAGYIGTERVKSAIFCEWAFGLGVARTYEVLMEGAPIKVRAFCTRAGAAKWLEIPPPLVQPIA